MLLEPRNHLNATTIGTGGPASTRRGRRRARDLVATEAAGVEFTRANRRPGAVGFGWIDLPAFDDAHPIHRCGVVKAQPGLYFVGLCSLSALTSSLVGGVGRDADHIVKQVGTEHEPTTPRAPHRSANSSVAFRGADHVHDHTRPRHNPQTCARDTECVTLARERLADAIAHVGIAPDRDVLRCPAARSAMTDEMAPETVRQREFGILHGALAAAAHRAPGPGDSIATPR